jgi:hypothetical protein
MRTGRENERREALAKAQHEVTRLPYSLIDPYNKSWGFASQEIQSWYVTEDPRAVIHGKIDARTPPLEIIAVSFYPVPDVDCAVQEFQFSATLEPEPRFIRIEKGLAKGVRETQFINLTASSPAKYFAFKVVKNHGGAFVCLPPFEFYGRPLKYYNARVTK